MEEVLRVLVVDDEYDSGEMFCELFDLLGHLATHVQSSQEAVFTLRRVTETPFDIILSDLTLGSGSAMNGMAFLSYIRLMGLSSAEAVLMTAEANEEVVNWCNEHQVTLLRKGGFVGLDNLKEVIRLKKVQA